MRRRRSPEVVAGRVNSDGTILAGTDFTSIRNSAGNYTLTFPGLRLVSLTGNASGAFVVLVTTYTDRNVIVVTNNMSSVSSDTAFSFQAVGYAA